jgi:hypothetical protein
LGGGLTVDITEFVAARLKDREDYAIQAAEEFGPDWIEIWSGTVDLTANRPDRQPEGRSGWETHVDTGDSRVSRFMVQNDPTRVLADVAAKRRILERHRNCGDGFGWCGEGGHGIDWELGRCHDLRDLAQIDETHPDFNPVWKADY